MLDQFLAAEMADRPYLHVMGFELSETGRARRDADYHTAQRAGSYPLISWGWDRAACEAYIRAVTGVDWQKSACTYCPFALCNIAGKARVLAAYRAEPAAGVHALVLEHIAVSLNPRQGLAAGERLSGLLAATGQHHDVLSAFAAGLGRMPWRVYEVRRVIRPRADDPARPGNASRSIRAIAAGSRAQMAASCARWRRPKARPSRTRTASSGPGCAAAVRRSPPLSTSWSPRPPGRRTRTAQGSMPPGRR